MKMKHFMQLLEENRISIDYTGFHNSFGILLYVHHDNGCTIKSLKEFDNLFECYVNDKETTFNLNGNINLERFIRVFRYFHNNLRVNTLNIPRFQKIKGCMKRFDFEYAFTFTVNSKKSNLDTFSKNGVDYLMISKANYDNTYFYEFLVPNQAGLSSNIHNLLKIKFGQVEFENLYINEKCTKVHDNKNLYKFLSLILSKEPRLQEMLISELNYMV